MSITANASHGEEPPQSDEPRSCSDRFPIANGIATKVDRRGQSAHECRKAVPHKDLPEDGNNLPTDENAEQTHQGD